MVLESVLRSQFALKHPFSMLIFGIVITFLFSDSSSPTHTFTRIFRRIFEANYSKNRKIRTDKSKTCAEKQPKANLKTHAKATGSGRFPSDASFPTTPWSSDGHCSCRSFSAPERFFSSPGTLP